jgi:hypothetical protein
MVNPVITFYKADDATQMNDTTPEDYGTVFTGDASSPVEIHIFNDKGGSAGSNPAYNVNVKIVSATGLDAGDTIVNGQEVVTGSWIGIKSITNSETTFIPVGNGTLKSLGTLNPNTDHIIQCVATVPDGATPAPSGTPNNDITFELEVLYTLTS